MRIGDLVMIKRAWKDTYEGYEDMIALVVHVAKQDRPTGFRRIRITHGEIQGQVYSVFAEEVLEVVCLK